jgi:dTDP-4-dehydrorhamnose reductase
MKKKIIILGSTGMLGHVVYLWLNNLNKYTIINTSYRNKLVEDTIILNLRNEKVTKDLILNEKPDIIINCVGILIKGSSESPSNSIYINSYLPHFLAEQINPYGGKLINISTDCVFSGNKGNYKEDDLKDASDIYGLSKSLGEINDSVNLTLRTSIIGPELKNGEGLFHWFMHQNKPISGYKSVIWNGVTTLELTKMINKAIDLNVTGIYNLSPFAGISKFDLLTSLKEIFNRQVDINPNYEIKKNKSLVDSRNVLKTDLSGYDAMLLELKDFMLSNMKYYNNYIF